MTTLTQTTEIVNFHNQELVTLKVGEIIYTAIRPIVEGMGLDWASQYTKLKKNAKKFSCCDIATTGKDGKIYEMLCMPIKKLNGWLFSINPEKVKADIRDIVIAYQEECFEALYNYWHNGKAINPRFEQISEEQAYIPKSAVEKRCKAVDRHYQTVWTALKHRFQVTSYKNILVKDFDNALNLVWTIALPEYIEPPKQLTELTLTHEQTQSITKLIVEVGQLSAMTANTFLRTVVLYDSNSFGYYKDFYKSAHLACINVVNSLGLKGGDNLPLITGRTINAPSGVRFNVDSALF